MKHPSEGSLRASLDGEVSDREAASIDLHLAACPACAASLAGLRERREALAPAFDSLRVSGGAEAGASSMNAVRTEIARRAAQPGSGATSTAGGRDGGGRRFALRVPGLGRPAWPWPAWAALAGTASLAIIFSVPPLRAAALDFMQLFRVERVEVASVNTPRELGDAMQSTELARILSDQVHFEPAGEEREVASTAEAAEAAGFDLRLPSMPEAPAEIVVEPGVHVHLVFDLRRAQEVLRELGRSDIVIPSSLDGAEVSMTVHPGVRVEYPEVNGHAGATLIQIPSPTISAPAGLPVEAIGQAFLEVLGMTREEAARFSHSVDWTTTLVVPVPRAGNDYREVSVDGVTGTLVHHQEERGDSYVLFWVKGGTIYALTGREAPAVIEMSPAPRVAERPSPGSVQLSVSPNPTRDAAEIHYTMTERAAKGGASEDGGGAMRLDIYDVSGRRVAEFPLAAGTREGSVRWDGTVGGGRPAAPGLYYARLTAGTAVATARISRVQ